MSQKRFYKKMSCFYKMCLKRLKLEKYNRSATQIFGLDYFIPHMAWYLWVYEKYPTEFFFGFKQGFQIGFFRFGQTFSNLTLFWCTWKNHYFEHFLGSNTKTGSDLKIFGQIWKIHSGSPVSNRKKKSLGNFSCTHRYQAIWGIK